MKTLLYALSFVLVSTWGVAQIDLNSTRSNSFGDLQLRRHNGGDTTWKRALVVGYNASNKDGRLYINYGGDFNLGTQIDGSTVSIKGNLCIGTTSPHHELSVFGANSPNIELKNTNYSNGGFVINRANYGHQWKWWAESNFMYFGFATDENTYSNKFTIKSNGNIGIGTTNPGTRLTLNNNLDYSKILQFGANGPTHWFMGIGNGGGDFFHIGDNSNKRLVIRKASGNIGIGTTNPKEKLSVNGNIRAKEVKVEIENWPDYVFKADYDLPSLDDVKKHIAIKGHLPNIPSAKEISEQGAALGALNVKLLEKIEELTLYTLDQEAQLQQQQHTINTLMERLTQIESQLNQHEKPTP